MARLAASICLAVIHFVPKDWRPKAPKTISVPLLSVPLDLPLCHFLCFTFLGIKIAILFKFFSFVYPDFYSHHSISAKSLDFCIVNIGSYCLAREPAPF